MGATWITHLLLRIHRNYLSFDITSIEYHLSIDKPDGFGIVIQIFRGVSLWEDIRTEFWKSIYPPLK